jgi:hypothetical protein
MLYEVVGMDSLDEVIVIFYGVEFVYTKKNKKPTIPVRAA